MTHPAGKFSFPRARRLGGRHAFAAVFAFKCSVAGKYFQVYAKPNGRMDARLGITVNKRFVPQATARNFCKRLARETFRSSGAGLDGIDLVVRARAVVLAASSSQARAEILELMLRAQSLCRAAGARSQAR